MTQTPAEEAHGRLIAGIDTRLFRVTYDDLLAVAQRAGTTTVPQVRRTLDALREREREEQAG